MHPKPLAGAVMLQDHGEAQLFRRRCKMLRAHHGNGRRRWDIKPRQRGILRNLGEFQLQGAPAIDHKPAMAFQMFNHRTSIFRRIGVPARVGRSTHTIVENALGRRGCQVQHALIQEPFLIRRAKADKSRAQRFHPGIIFVNNKDLRHAASPNLHKKKAHPEASARA